MLSRPAELFKKQLHIFIVSKARQDVSKENFKLSKSYQYNKYLTAKKPK